MRKQGDLPMFFEAWGGSFGAVDFHVGPETFGHRRSSRPRPGDNTDGVDELAPHAGLSADNLRLNKNVDLVNPSIQFLSSRCIICGVLRDASELQFR